MSLFERIVRALIYVCFVALAFWLIVWVLGAIGFTLPYMVQNILVVILVLCVILILYRMFASSLPGGPLFPPRQ